VPPETLREDPGGLDRGCLVEIVDDHERTQRKPPRPPRALRVVLRVTHDLDDGKDRLPDRRVTDREVAALDGGPPG
jgi:hypothetical protein